MDSLNVSTDSGEERVVTSTVADQICAPVGLEGGRRHDVVFRGGLDAEQPVRVGAGKGDHLEEGGGGERAGAEADDEGEAADDDAVGRQLVRLPYARAAAAVVVRVLLAVAFRLAGFAARARHRHLTAQGGTA